MIGFLFAAGVMVGSVSGASIRPDRENTPSCGQLRQQLQAMQKAQVSLLSSMVNKNDATANLLDRYARDFEEQGLQLREDDTQSLRSSAQAFRRHREREKKLVQKFDHRSQVLIQQISSCLAKMDRPSLRPNLSAGAESTGSSVAR